MQGMGYKFVEQSGRSEKGGGRYLAETKGRGVIPRSCQCPGAKPRGCVFSRCVGDMGQFNLDVLKGICINQTCNFCKGAAPAHAAVVQNHPILLSQ